MRDAALSFLGAVLSATNLLPLLPIDRSHVRRLLGTCAPSRLLRLPTALKIDGVSSSTLDTGGLDGSAFHAPFSTTRLVEQGLRGGSMHRAPMRKRVARHFAKGTCFVAGIHREGTPLEPHACGRCVRSLAIGTPSFSEKALRFACSRPRRPRHLFASQVSRSRQF